MSVTDDRQTDRRQTDDRQTDGRATANSAREREFTFAKMVIYYSFAQKLPCRRMCT